MRAALAILAVLLAGRTAAASEDAYEEEDVLAEGGEVEIDAVTSSHPSVPRPDLPTPPRVQRDGDRLIVGCIQLRMVPDYDGHSILALTFRLDGRCGQPPEEVTPPITP